MKVPLVVAVSQRVDYLSERGERRDALDQRLCVWLKSVGYLPVPVPNCLTSKLVTTAKELETDLSTWLHAIRPSAVVLSGGNDIGEYPERDATEYSLLVWAENVKVPVLGICRGMQMMSVHASGKLKPVEGHVQTRHVLHGSIVDEVNSFHRFTLDGCPSGFQVLAKSADNEIEAIRHVDLPWEGWMWHPEREKDFSASDVTRIRKLFRA
jgi:putative glutamine amidotransferase